MEVNKAKNMIEHEQEIFSRPARTWFEPKTGRTGKKRPSAPGRQHCSILISYR
jgi:ATP-dependent RNA helicase DDX27